MFPFDRLGAVEIPAMRAEVRSSPRAAASHGIWTAPTNVLTFRFSPGNTFWTRPTSKQADFQRGGPLTFRPLAASWETRSNGAPVLSVVIHFRSALLPGNESDGDPCDIQDLSMIELMRLLHNEIRTPGFASTAMVESISEVLHIKLSRLMRSPDESESESGTFGKSQLALIHDYIEAQSGASPSVEELARLLKMSRRSLLRRFKSSTGKTAVSYITQVQIEKAKRLLSTSNRLIKQIANDTGFKSPSSFGLAFERHVGLTPTAFQALARGGRRTRDS
jgi:AraC family transcriptional regulator